MTNQQPLLDRIRDLETKVETLETQLAQAVWNYGEAKREVLMEREACAKICKEITLDMWNLYKGNPPYKGDEAGRASDFTQGRSAGAEDCLLAIIARGNT